MVWSGWLSLTTMTRCAMEEAFIGVDNYLRMAADPRVRLSLWNTAYFTLLYVPLSIGPLRSCSPRC